MKKLKKGLEALRGGRWKDKTPYKRWDCSKIENEEEEESWQEGDQMAEHWEEVQQLEEVVVRRRRMEGSSLKLDVAIGAKRKLS